MTERGRPADAALSWFALGVVTALDQAGVSLDVDRRDTAVVEILGLVRRWAHRKVPVRTTRQRTYDVAFSRHIVKTYRTNPR